MAQNAHSMGEQRYALALASAGAGTWYWDCRTGTVEWDPAMEALYGLEPGTFGGTFDDWIAKVHPADRDDVLTTLHEVLDTGGDHHVLYRTDRPDGAVRWIEGRGRPLIGDDGQVTGLVGACQDVTERQEARAAEQRAHERLEFLVEGSALLARSLEVEDTLAEFVELAVPRLADWCAVDLLERGDLRRVAVAHRDPQKAETAERLRARYGSPRVHGGWAVVRSGEPEILPVIDDALLAEVAEDEEHLALLHSLGLSSAVIVPLRARGEILGVLTLVTADSGRRYDDEDLRLAENLAARAGVAVSNAQLLAERSHVVRTLQQALLPPGLPSVPGIDVAAHYDTASSLDVGGDFYDLLGAGSDWHLIVGDVRGKGADAASLTALARHTVRAGALGNLPPDRILAILNDALLEQQEPERFCTAVCGHLRLQNDHATLTLAAGGHPQPLLLRADGTVEPVDCGGLLVGAFPEPRYEPTTVILRPGDLAFFYTDGIEEARAGDEEFGQDRLQEALAASVGLPAASVLKHVHDAVESFQTAQRDDMAMLALRPLQDTEGPSGAEA